MTTKTNFYQESADRYSLSSDSLTLSSKRSNSANFDRERFELLVLNHQWIDLEKYISVAFANLSTQEEKQSFQNAIEFALLHFVNDHPERKKAAPTMIAVLARYGAKANGSNQRLLYLDHSVITYGQVKPKSLYRIYGEQGRNNKPVAFIASTKPEHDANRHTNDNIGFLFNPDPQLKNQARPLANYTAFSYLASFDTLQTLVKYIPADVLDSQQYGTTLIELLSNMPKISEDEKQQITVALLRSFADITINQHHDTLKHLVPSLAELIDNHYNLQIARKKAWKATTASVIDFTVLDQLVSELLNTAGQTQQNASTIQTYLINLYQKLINQSCTLSKAIELISQQTPELLASHSNRKSVHPLLPIDTHLSFAQKNTHAYSTLLATTRKKTLELLPIEKKDSFDQLDAYVAEINNILLNYQGRKIFARWEKISEIRTLIINTYQQVGDGTLKLPDVISTLKEHLKEIKIQVERSHNGDQWPIIFRIIRILFVEIFKTKSKLATLLDSVTNNTRIFASTKTTNKTTDDKNFSNRNQTTLTATRGNTYVHSICHY